MGTEEKPRTKYKRYWIGKCINTHKSTNLVVGQLYLLKDKTGQQSHFTVSKFISNNDSFIGHYRAIYFEILLDVTQAIEGQPYQDRVQEYEMWVDCVKMVSREKGMSIAEAQQFLINKGALSEPVVDDTGNKLRTDIQTNIPDLIVDQLPEEFDVTSEAFLRTGEVRPRSAARVVTTEFNPEGTEFYPVGTQTSRMSSSQENTSSTPKSEKVEKPKTTKKEGKTKLVQKGLFG